MTIYKFMSESPWLTFFIVLIGVCGAVSLVHTALAYMINRPLRHLSIRTHGWPPAHCDADGDFKQIKEGEK